MRRAIVLLILLSVFGCSPTAFAVAADLSVPEPTAGFSWTSLGRGVSGMAVLLFLGWLLSRDRKRIDWTRIGVGLACQTAIALAILYVPAVQWCFEVLGRCFLKILDFSHSGARFLFGDLVDLKKTGHIFAFQTLPTLVFFSALTALLYYLKVIQRIVRWTAYPLKRLFRLSGAEGVTVAGNIFLGQCEAPMLVRYYLPTMNRSEIFLVMSAGLATIAGGVMAAYIGLLGGDDPQTRLLFAKYLISASVMAAPGVIVFARLIVPQTELSVDDIRVSRQEVGTNAIDAVSRGAVDGLKLALNVGALLLVFVAMVAMANYLLDGLIGRYTGLNALIAEWSDGRYSELSFQFLLGLVFTPLVWLMGVCSGDMIEVGGLLGSKLVLNEFVAYADLHALKQAGAFVQEKSIVMATYLLCGFANVGSVGMLVGGLTPLAPNQRPLFVRYGFLAMLCGALASCMSATIVGLILG